MKQEVTYSLEYLVEKEEEGLLREYLLEHKRLSRRSLSTVKHAGDLLINGKSVTVRAEVKEGDQVTVIFPEEESSFYLKPEPLPLDILDEDEDILVINKAPHLCVHPTFTHREGTLANGVMYYWQKKGWKRTFHAVNRLDKNTSGIILLAQNRFSHQQLSLQQKAHQIKRRYYALVHGLVANDQGVIEAPIGRKEDSIIEREVRADGQYAQTTYWVKERYVDYTWIELELETGRTHQIRVHLSQIGHPLLGDTLYGGKTQHIPRQALHAYYTSFKHPKTGEELRYQAPIPKDIRVLLGRN